MGTTPSTSVFAIVATAEVPLRTSVALPGDYQENYMSSHPWSSEMTYHRTPNNLCSHPSWLLVLHWLLWRELKEGTQCQNFNIKFTVISWHEDVQCHETMVGAYYELNGPTEYTEDIGRLFPKSSSLARRTPWLEVYGNKPHSSLPHQSHNKRWSRHLYLSTTEHKQHVVILLCDNYPKGSRPAAQDRETKRDDVEESLDDQVCILVYIMLQVVMVWLSACFISQRWDSMGGFNSHELHTKRTINGQGLGQLNAEMPRQCMGLNLRYVYRLPIWCICWECQLSIDSKLISHWEIPLHMRMAKCHENTVEPDCIANWILERPWTSEASE